MAFQHPRPHRPTESYSSSSHRRSVSVPRGPRFDLGGQVSSHRSVGALTASASNVNSVEDEFTLSNPGVPPAAPARSLHSVFQEPHHYGGSRMSSIDPLYYRAEDLEHPTKSLNPEMLMREFTEDEQGTSNSPSSMFKSSFAKEVVQNVRKSMTSLQNAGLSDVTPPPSAISVNPVNHLTGIQGGRSSMSSLGGFRSQFAAQQGQVSDWKCQL